MFVVQFFCLFFSIQRSSLTVTNCAFSALSRRNMKIMSIIRYAYGSFPTVNNYYRFPVNCFFLLVPKGVKKRMPLINYVTGFPRFNYVES